MTSLESEKQERLPVIDFSSLFNDGDASYNGSSDESESQPEQLADMWTEESEEITRLLDEYQEREKSGENDEERYQITSYWESQMMDEIQQEGLEGLHALFRLKMDSVEEVAQALAEWGVSEEHYYVKEWNSTAGVKYQPMLRMLGGGRGRKKDKKRKGRRGIERTTRVPLARHIVADKSVVDLVYIESGVLSSSFAVAKRWHTNGAYDVDPVLGGNSVNGFNNWSRFYSFNRVLSYFVTLTLTNQEATPVHAYFVHMNTDPTTTTTNYPIWSTQAFGMSITMSGSVGGKDRFVYTKAHSIRQIVGDKMPITSERYVGSSTANPADLTFFGVSVADANGFEMTSGVVYQLRLNMRIEFFDRKNFNDVTITSNESEEIGSSNLPKDEGKVIADDKKSAKPTATERKVRMVRDAQKEKQ